MGIGHAARRTRTARRRRLPRPLWAGARHRRPDHAAALVDAPPAQLDRRDGARTAAGGAATPSIPHPLAPASRHRSARAGNGGPLCPRAHCAGLDADPHADARRRCGARRHRRVAGAPQLVGRARRAGRGGSRRSRGAAHADQRTGGARLAHQPRRRPRRLSLSDRDREAAREAKPSGKARANPRVSARSAPRRACRATRAAPARSRPHRAPG